MGYSPWGRKELDVTERLNNSNIQLLTGKTSSKERNSGQASSSYGMDRGDGPKKSQLVNLERKLAPHKFLCLFGFCKPYLYTPPHSPYCSTPGNSYVKTNPSSSKIRAEVERGAENLENASCWWVGRGSLHDTSLHDGIRIHIISLFLLENDVLKKSFLSI